MRIAPADPLTRARVAKRQDRFPSFRLLESLSIFHSCVYLALLIFWLGPDDKSATMVLGWTHGILWIGMSLLCIVAARHRTIPFWLAVSVAVIGGVGPFAGTIGFLWEQRRRTRQQAPQGAPQRS